MRYGLVTYDGKLSMITLGTPGNLDRLNWLPIVDDATPFDPEAQIVTDIDYIVGFDSIQEVKIIRNLTVAELDQNKERKLDRLDDVVMRVLFNHENRLRTLESRPQVTMDQFKAAIRQLI